MSLVVYCNKDDTLVVRPVAKFLRPDTAFPKLGDLGRIKWKNSTEEFTAVVVHLSTDINHNKNAKSASKNMENDLVLSGRSFALKHGLKLKDSIVEKNSEPIEIAVPAEKEQGDDMNAAAKQTEVLAVECASLKRKLEELQGIGPKIIKLEQENMELKEILVTLKGKVTGFEEGFMRRDQFDEAKAEMIKQFQTKSSTVCANWTVEKLLDECAGEKFWKMALARAMNKIFSVKELISSCPTPKGAQVSPADRSPLDPAKMEIIYEFVKQFCLGLKSDVPRQSEIHTKLRSFLQTCRKSYDRDWKPKETSVQLESSSASASFSGSDQSGSRNEGDSDTENEDD